MAEADHGLHNRRIGRVGAQAGDEHLVNLQGVYRKAV